MATRLEAVAPADIDWFADAAEANRRREEERRAHPMSAAWGHGGTGGDAVARLRSIRDAVRSLARVQGVPPACRVELAVVGQEGAAVAGFDDAPEGFTRPFILLDRGIAEHCEPDEVRDVYCGVGLHEAGHVLHTRDGYRRLAQGLPRRRRLYENLFEDERVEELVRRDSPGYASYIQAAKRALLERGEPGRALANWDALPDLDKVNLLFFAFIRLPHRIDDRIKGWAVPGGECVFETLRRMFPAAPASEADVERFAIELDGLWQRLRALYPDDPAGNAGSPGAEDAEAEASRERQRVADAEDQAIDPPASPEDDPADRTIAGVVDRLLEEAARREEAGREEEAKSLLDRAIRVEESGDAWQERDGRRFGVADLKRAIERSSTVGGTLTEAEAAELDRRERDRETDGDRWDWGAERRTVIARPLATDEDRHRYDAARRQVRGHVAAMRAAFGLRLGQRTRHERERTEGRLDRRRLGLGPVTDRVFRRIRVEAGRGLALCLLLDESGSMGQGKLALGGCAPGRRPDGRVAQRAARRRVGSVLAQLLRRRRPGLPAPSPLQSGEHLPGGARQLRPQVHELRPPGDPDGRGAVRAEHAGPPSGDARPQRRPAERDGLRREAGDPRHAPGGRGGEAARHPGREYRHRRLPERGDLRPPTRREIHGPRQPGRQHAGPAHADRAAGGRARVRPRPPPGHRPAWKDHRHMPVIFHATIISILGCRTGNGTILGGSAGRGVIPAQMAGRRIGDAGGPDEFHFRIAHGEL